MLSTIISVGGVTAMLVYDGIRIANSTNPTYVAGNVTERLVKNLAPVEAKAIIKDQNQANFKTLSEESNIIQYSNKNFALFLSVHL